MKLALTRRLIPSAILAVGLLAAGPGASIARGQSRPTDTSSETQRTRTYGDRPETGSFGRSSWGLLGLLGLFGLLGARRSRPYESRGTYETRTYEPRTSH